MVKIVSFLWFVSSVTLAADIPGGQTRLAESLPSNSYELVITPGYALGAAREGYLSSKLRYQPDEDWGLGLGFGAGEKGFHLGLDGMLNTFPQIGNQPAIGFFGGVYFNRREDSHFLVLRVGPVTSYTFATGFGSVSPYAGVHLAPSFRVAGRAEGDISLRAPLGTVIQIKEWNSMQLWYEWNLGLANAPQEILFGFSYPFTAL